MHYGLEDNTQNNNHIEINLQYFLNTNLHHGYTDDFQHFVQQDHYAVYYCVRNSVVYFSGYVVTEIISGAVVREGFPKSLSSAFTPLVSAEGTTIGTIYIDQGTSVVKYNAQAVGIGYFSLSFPIAN